VPSICTYVPSQRNPMFWKTSIASLSLLADEIVTVSVCPAHGRTLTESQRRVGRGGGIGIEGVSSKAPAPLPGAAWAAGAISVVTPSVRTVRAVAASAVAASRRIRIDMTNSFEGCCSPK
jgi:hypothetical protein